MFFKPGVKVFGVANELTLAMIAADQVYDEFGQEFVVTSVVDSKHSRTSLHYAGMAFDCRTRDTDPVTIEKIAGDLRARLTNEYDVVVESDHLHIEFQPKR